MNLEALYPSLRNFLKAIEKEFSSIPEQRVAVLNQLAAYIERGLKKNEAVNLVFICTHNSRRSHIAQIWAQTAAYVYELDSVFCFSGGTEATAFNPRAVKAMKEIGFDITLSHGGNNPIYDVTFSEAAPAIKVFSKTYNHPANPRKSFVAVMTCSNADENCPYIPGVDVRIPLTYDDPKDFDGTPLEGEKYSERVREIGREILFAFRRLKAES